MTTIDDNKIKEIKDLVPEFIISIRTERMGMVQNQEQLDLVYQILEKFFTGEIVKYEQLTGEFDEKIMQMFSDELGPKVKEIYDIYKTQ